MSESEKSGAPAADTIERSFTCSVCGFPMVHAVRRLQPTIRATCHNCGDWTLQAADLSELLPEAENVAEELAGEILTERQALAYLLREVLEVDRETAADAMESSPSNVDNLHRRGVEKVEDMTRMVETLQRVSTEES